MAKWHEIYRWYKIIKDIKNDIALIDIYQQEIKDGYANSEYRFWVKNVDKRFKQFFNKKIIDFIPITTLKNRKYVDNYNAQRKEMLGLCQQKSKN